MYPQHWNSATSVDMMMLGNRSAERSTLNTATSIACSSATSLTRRRCPNNLVQVSRSIVQAVGGPKPALFTAGLRLTLLCAKFDTIRLEHDLGPPTLTRLCACLRWVRLVNASSSVISSEHKAK